MAIEALGTQGTFEGCLRSLRPGGTLSSLGVYGGKERMRRLLEMVRSGHFDPAPLVTHRFRLDEIEAAYALFGDRREGVLKVAISP